MRPAAGIFGTPAYMAPEETEAAGVATEKTDLYSLGLVLYELLTGAPPFDDSDRDVLRELHRTAAPEPPSRRAAAVDPRLERCILDLLAKDPEKRPDSARAVGEALVECRDREPRTQREIEKGERTPVTLLLCRLVPLPECEVEVTQGTVRLFQARCAALVHLHGGRVVRHLDRGLLVQFGYPEAEEEASESAARAGLALLDDARGGALARELEGKAGCALAIDIGSAVRRGNHCHPRVSGTAILRRLEELGVGEALEGWRRAGSIALSRSAFAEAASFFQRALRALAAETKGSAKTSLEVELWTSLSLAETGLGGPCSTGVAKCMGRVRALCPRLEDDRELARSLFILYRYSMVSSDKSRALELMETLAAVCDRIEDAYTQGLR